MIHPFRYFYISCFIVSLTLYLHFYNKYQVMNRSPTHGRLRFYVRYVAFMFPLLEILKCIL